LRSIGTGLEPAFSARGYASEPISGTVGSIPHREGRVPSAFFPIAGPPQLRAHAAHARASAIETSSQRAHQSRRCRENRMYTPQSCTLERVETNPLSPVTLSRHGRKLQNFKNARRRCTRTKSSWRLRKATAAVSLGATVSRLPLGCRRRFPGGEIARPCWPTGERASLRGALALGFDLMALYGSSIRR